MAYYLYILYSESSDKYYIGQTNDVEGRLLAHNSSDRKTYTSKHRPWVLLKSFTFPDRCTAMLVEKTVKKKKSRRIIQEIIADIHTSEELLDFLGLNSSAG
ncbi:GIY-YIG nuclease family protein [Parapedobacter sp. SGR-10]|uniref:GIY-YIG nuclease family protein n=1 Tax=Parapedobacter sp. SGR-10 TaxID=2710879 RepID=UPI0013D4D358|nr:GIY-YIG nuclease family protein [Parapedobacter sp. SGR-10]